MESCPPQAPATVARKSWTRRERGDQSCLGNLSGACIEASAASCTGSLTLAQEHDAVVAAPRSAVRRAKLGGLVALVAQTTVLSTSGGQAALLAVLVHRVDDPVDARVAADGLAHRVNGDDLVPLERGVHVHPVRVQHTQVAEALAQTLLRNGLVVLVELHAEHTAGLRLTVRDTLVSRALATTTAHAHAEHAEALLRLVAKHAGLLRARGAAQAHHRVLVTELPRADTLDKAHHIGRLLLPQLVQVHESPHGYYTPGVVGLTCSDVSRWRETRSPNSACQHEKKKNQRRGREVQPGE
ncbi:ribosomal protein L15, putative [Leishmania tarentolae]|uniref:Ribosomal protein L15, putative n=1 Tax=Leishmania tarentolae TaxID=5689 RepID=A0A640KT44_LEITA|nr:ribosomal protein L15, putative [Leishmania tarentolae]